MRPIPCLSWILSTYMYVQYYGSARITTNLRFSLGRQTRQGKLPGTRSSWFDTTIQVWVRASFICVYVCHGVTRSPITDASGRHSTNWNVRLDPVCYARLIRLETDSEQILSTEMIRSSTLHVQLRDRYQSFLEKNNFSVFRCNLKI